MQPRVILALATENPSDAIWGRIRMLADEIFAGPVAVKFAYYGREGAGATRRPCIATDWVTVADDWTDIVDQGRVDCVCGCFMQTDDFLTQALRETRQTPVQAVVILGGFHGKLDTAVATAKLLRAVAGGGFSFQKAGENPAGRELKVLAGAGGGAFSQHNPHVDLTPQRLRKMMEAIPDSAVGAKAAWKARGENPANLLLEQ